MANDLKDTGVICSECKEHTVSEGYCAGCKDPINTHCDACISAIQCQDCGDYFGNVCCMDIDPMGNRCNKCFAIHEAK
jgi:hypothetical protein